ncbi:LysR substrate-binding domain-containing protein [Rhodobacteraceae bacterium KMM 6894]|nr:LysR substrate-binding domain-containing protein [Rhodobacteraceae bacterium KMM 6894]
MDGSPQPTLRDRFLQGMSHAACTVNVITTDGPAGRAGVTVSAMSSVSADTDRPTMLVCVHHLSQAAAMIQANGVLCVNVLRDDQSHVSDTFAGRFKGEVEDKFDCADWLTCASGAPRLASPLVAFDCALVSSEKVGTHHIFLCEVTDTHGAEGGSPLIYANRAYGAARRIDSMPSLRAARAAEGRALRIGYFPTIGPYILPRLIAALSGPAPQMIEGDRRALCQALQTGACDVALMYDIGLGDGFQTQPLTDLTPYVLLPGDHPLTAEARLTPVMLEGLPMVLLDTDPSRDFFPGLLTAAGVTPTIAHRAPSLEMVRGMVAHGLGYALLATKPASAMSYDGLSVTARPLEGVTGTGRVVLAWPKEQTLVGAAAQFSALCRDAFQPPA